MSASISVTIKRNDIKKILSRIPTGCVVAGLPRGSGSYENGESVVQAGINNEFGVEGTYAYAGHNSTVVVQGIPERPFMSATAFAGRSKWPKLVAENIGLILEGTTSGKGFLDSLGNVMANDIRETIQSRGYFNGGVPNSPQVVADKGSSHPLIDTGRMIGAITHEVRDS